MISHNLETVHCVSVVTLIHTYGTCKDLILKPNPQKPSVPHPTSNISDLSNNHLAPACHSLLSQVFRLSHA